MNFGNKHTTIMYLTMNTAQKRFKFVFSLFFVRNSVKFRKSYIHKHFQRTPRKIKENGSHRFKTRLCNLIKPIRRKLNYHLFRYKMLYLKISYFFHHKFLKNKTISKKSALELASCECDEKLECGTNFGIFQQESL